MAAESTTAAKPTRARPPFIGRVTPELVQEISEVALVDRRTVWKWLAGLELRPKTQARIDRAIAAIGARE
jgi:hypothetical protein